MATHTIGRFRNVKKPAAVALGAAAMGAAFAGLSAGTASAEVQESAPAPYVTSRQALLVDDNALRVADYGEARGFGDTRSADAGIVHAQGEGVHVDTVKAVPGTTAAPFNLEANGAFVFSPPIGDW
ncbi:hypothetical protein [Mycolicibacterium bacteremicum]|uniref:Uncharacterized protein n=1 Tax=Mycolicibacterium bacteremicum TaxID=564198 RepID=A0A1W9YXM7_MYCBA|nr:hypothetical protein [Mycolicibacterium bacteremicum]MCV7430753.1 hypothetical protein [Mycolicibacterium bacteremicum]ORA04816.1 hypothetical protein BST17_11695 [Mycolicibacterium bacteremicum]